MASSNNDLVIDWLRDCKRLTGVVEEDPSSSPGKSRGEASAAAIEAIFRVLDDPKINLELLEGICDQLYAFYRSRDEKLQRQAICFIPSLIGLHLDRLKAGLTASRDKKYQCIDVILLGIYNLEVVDEDGNPVERKFRIPNLSKPSVYHEPSSHTIQSQASSILTEQALMKLETGSSDSVISSFGPFNEFDQISASTRMTILTVLMKVYNQNLSSVPKESLRSVCRTVLKVIPCTVPSNLPSKSTDLYFTPTHNHSTNKTSSASAFMEMISKAGPRVHLSPDLLVELSYSVYFCLYNDVVLEGRRALDRIHSNALYHLYPNVLLMTNSIRNSLRINLSYQESQESPLDISLSALSPTSSVANTVTAGISKTAITNASFRTRKLPEDIPIITNLTSISEGEEGLKETPITPPATADSSKSHKGFGSSGKTKEALTGKNSILHLLKKDKKSRDTGSKKEKLRAENGDVTKVMKEETSGNQELDVGSVSSGISESKSFTSDLEMIPLNTMSSKNNIITTTTSVSVTSTSSNSSTTTATGTTANIIRNTNDNNEEEHTSDLSEEENSSKPLIVNNESNGTSDGPAISV